MHIENRRTQQKHPGRDIKAGGFSYQLHSAHVFFSFFFSFFLFFLFFLVFLITWEKLKQAFITHFKTQAYTILLKVSSFQPACVPMIL